MATIQRKRLMPKSAFLVKKYRRGIRVSFTAICILLTLLFIMHVPSSTTKENISLNTGTETDGLNAFSGSSRSDYLLPFTDKSQHVIHPKDDGIKENAVMITLARNSDLWNLVNSIRHVEDRFNHKYHYDWVFLNDDDFTDEFKRVTSNLVSGKAKYGKIPKEQFSIPSWIDQDKLATTLKNMRDNNVIYGDSVPYRHMCRFQAGLFYRHPLLQQYNWYWRVDTDITIFCDIQYDLFKFLRVNNKMYGFILSVSEYEATIPTLWSTTRKFMKEYPHLVHKNNLMDYISDDNGENYNLCHFWSNFEIGSLDLWRSEAYDKYFEYLDQSGGFYYERWGDAPVHSIAAALFLDRSQIHFFDGLGFHHPDFLSCPVEEDIRLQNHCTCNPTRDVTWGASYFCTRKFFLTQNYALPPGV
ncbi:mannosyltransferase ktr3 [Zygosaccharomyces mellis]|uniref:Mannosyltransferase ktr3 n=1 Tax=Zygosaccharomyces mellis TaxID=42258 RepID=A0A4C2E9X1_9SACH|nr:mannosyltransferase ktr3 [Zygosaccharomyces mellis]